MSGIFWRTHFWHNVQTHRCVIRSRVLWRTYAFGCYVTHGVCHSVPDVMAHFLMTRGGGCVIMSRTVWRTLMSLDIVTQVSCGIRPKHKMRQNLPDTVTYVCCAQHPKIKGVIISRIIWRTHGFGRYAVSCLWIFWHICLFGRYVALQCAITPFGR